jgi:hypothetical protein
LKIFEDGVAFVWTATPAWTTTAPSSSSRSIWRQRDQQMQVSTRVFAWSFAVTASYNLHLKTADIQQPWQSYRTRFATGSEWREIQLPFSRFAPHRIDVPIDLRKLQRIGLVAIGAALTAELCVAEIGFY